MLSINTDGVLVRKPYDPVVCDPRDAGDIIEPVYRLRRDENENCIYVKVGERNVDEYIASFKNGCALSSILDRIKLMPVNDKISYLHQTSDGFSADISNMPSDGTDAFIMVQKLGRKYPQIFERVAKGESFDAVITDIFKPKAVDSTPPAEPTPKGDEK